MSGTFFTRTTGRLCHWTCLALATMLSLGPGAQFGLAAARNVDVRTTDRGKGGRLAVTISWSGKAPYSGKIYGHIFDTGTNDQHCVQAFALLDGDKRFIGGACPNNKGNAVNLSFHKKNQVLVRVCLSPNPERPGPSRDVYCSDWT